MQRQPIEKRYHEKLRNIAIAATVASFGIFSPVTVPIIVRESYKIAQINRHDKQDSTKLKM